MNFLISIFAKCLACYLENTKNSNEPFEENNGNKIKICQWVHKCSLLKS